MCGPQSRPRALTPHAVMRSSSWLSFPPVWCSVHARTPVYPSYHKCPSGLFAVWGHCESMAGNILSCLPGVTWRPMFSALPSLFPLSRPPSYPLFSLPCFLPLSSHSPDTGHLGGGPRERGRAWPRERARNGALSQRLFPPPR